MKTLHISTSTRLINLCALCSILCFAVLGEELPTKNCQLPTIRAELATRSAFMDYGLVVGRAPVFVPSGRVTWGGWFVDAFSVIDYTDGMRHAAAEFNGRTGYDARTWNFSAG